MMPRYITFPKCSAPLCSCISNTATLIQRQATRQNCIVHTQLAVRLRQISWNSVLWVKNYSVLGRLEAAKAWQKFLVSATNEPTKEARKDPFHMYCLGVSVGMCELSSDVERVGDVRDMFVGQWVKFTLRWVHGSLVVSLDKAFTP